VADEVRTSEVSVVAFRVCLTRCHDGTVRVEEAAEHAHDLVYIYSLERLEAAVATLRAAVDAADSRDG